jgi:hypothetical protein
LSLQRLVLTFKPEGVETRALYRTESSTGLGTKARQREASELARTRLKQVLDALEGGVECVGTSGFSTREDVLLASALPDAAELGQEA